MTSPRLVPCVKCGFLIPSGVNYCSRCGAQQLKPPAQPPVQPPPVTVVIQPAPPVAIRPPVQVGKVTEIKPQEPPPVIPVVVPPTPPLRLSIPVEIPQEYLPEKRSERKELGTNEYLDVKFKVKNPGQITIQASLAYGWGITLPLFIPRKIELFRPGGTRVVNRTYEALGFDSITTYEVPFSEAGSTEDWTARITNLGDRVPVGLLVSYPGDIPLSKFEGPISFLENLFTALIRVKGMKIHLTRGDNASYIYVPEVVLGVGEIKFTVADWEKKIWLPWPFPDIHIREYVNDINSSNVTFSLINATPGGWCPYCEQPAPDYPFGAVRFVVDFEGEGKEILGTWHGQMSNMQLTLDLPLEARDGKISYRDHVGVRFSFHLDVMDIPDKIEKWAKLEDRVRQSVEEKVRSFFEAEETRQKFSDALTRLLAPSLGSNPRIVSVNIQNNQLTIRYYNA